MKTGVSGRLYLIFSKECEKIAVKTASFCFFRLEGALFPHQLSMGTLKGFPFPPATLRCRQSRQAPHAFVDGNPERVPIPSRDGAPATFRCRQSSPLPTRLLMGTFKGFARPRHTLPRTQTSQSSGALPWPWPWPTKNPRPRLWPRFSAAIAGFGRLRSRGGFYSLTVMPSAAPRISMPVAASSSRRRRPRATS